MGKELDFVEHKEVLATIIEEYILKGKMDPGFIAKSMKMTRAEVQSYINEWHEIARSDYHIQQRAQEALVEFDKGLDKAVEVLWEIIDDADTSTSNRLKATTEYRDTIAKRHDILQKAGLYEDVQEKEEIRLAREQMDQIRELLKSVANEYPVAKNMILSGLAAIFEQPQSTGVVDVNVVKSEVNEE